MNDEEIKSEIRKFALQNAVEHEGQTRDKTILAKIMGNVPELRQKAKEIGPIITEVVSEINQISLEEQQKEIEEKFDEMNFAITDLSHSKAIIELEGNQVKEVLKKGCPFNFDELNKNNCLNSTFNGLSITVDMLNDDPCKVRIFSLRSFGESMYHSITDASLEFGYIGN